MKLAYGLAAALLSLAAITASPAAAADQPNILVIWGDDIGITNISAYSDGIMGYRTPNIDRIASEGMRFTDYYGDQSCTAGRADFITGQAGLRTGLTKVGLPGADLGLQDRDITIAEVLRRTAMPRASSVRTTLATRTRSCPPITVSMSFSATSTTSTPKKSQRT